MYIIRCPLTLHWTQNDVAKINLITQPFSIKSRACRDRAQKNKAGKQTEEDFSCFFGDRKERNTNSHFLLSYCAILTLIFDHLTIECGEKYISYNTAKMQKEDKCACSFQIMNRNGIVDDKKLKGNNNSFSAAHKKKGNST